MSFNQFQLICNAVLLSGANMFGVYHKYLTDITHRHTFLEARKSIESMVKLEKEKKEQVCSIGMVGGARVRAYMSRVMRKLDDNSDMATEAFTLMTIV